MTVEEKKLKVLHDRLAKIGVKVQFGANYPWLYLHTVNGKLVTEKAHAEHGFAIMFMPIRMDDPPKDFIDISEMFQLIRKYI